MPNSSWTETGTSIDLVPVSTTITDSGAEQNSADYLTNSDKIALMAQYAAELATKTQLDTEAGSLSVPTANYDNAVAGINTTLVNGGAPANWATEWPDGATFGPSTGIQIALAGDWAGIATARTSLQSAISAVQATQQAAEAQAAAVATAATDATTKMNSAISAAQTYASTAQANAIAAAATDATNKTAAAVAMAGVSVVNGLPSLPNAAYPVGKQVVDSTTGYLWTNFLEGGVQTWDRSNVSASLITDQITAAQIAAGAVGAAQIAAGAITTKALTVANFDNLIPNPNSEQAAPTGGWPSGALEGAFVTAGNAYAGSNCRMVNNAIGYVTPLIPVNAGDSFVFQAMVKVAAGIGYIAFHWTDAAGNAVKPDPYVQTTSTSYVLLSFSDVAPSGAAFVRAYIQQQSPAANGYFDNLYMRRMADASLIVDGIITTNKMQAGSVTTSILAANAVQANNIAAGAITANKLAITPVGACINYDPAMSDTTAWTQDGGTGTIALNVGPASTAGSVGGTFTESDSGQDNTLISVQTYPIDPAKVYKLSANLFTVSGNNRNMYIFVEFYTGSGVYVGSSSTGWGGTRSGYVYGAAPPQNAFTRCGGQFGYGTSRPIPSNVSKCKIGVWFQYAGAGSSSVAQVAQDLRLEPVVDASLIVDGTITAAKIAAGAITADMITTGTLNAANVAVTNLSASNITTGTLSATKVLFGDGTALTSAARVSTQTKQPTGTATSTGVVGDTGSAVAIPGLSFSISSNGADTFNIMATLDLIPSVIASSRQVSIYLVVDGNTSSPYVDRRVTPTLANALFAAPFFCVVSGLAAGSHTIAFYIKDHAGNTTYSTTAQTSSYAICQRIY